MQFNLLKYEQRPALLFSSSLWMLKLGFTCVVAFIFIHAINPMLQSPGYFKHFLDAMTTWDGEFYKTIAQYGYVKEAHSAFFPLYPLLIKGLQKLLSCKYSVSALIIANVAFFLSLWIFYQLIEFDHGVTIAQKTLLLLITFPTALFFNMGYSESCNLLFLLLFFYCLKKDKWYPAIFFAACATLVHDLGVLLCCSALCVWFKNRASYSTSQTILRFLSMGFIPLVLCGYMFFLWIHYGTPFEFLHAQTELWSRKILIPVYSIIRFMFHLQHLHWSSSVFIAYVQIFVSLLFILLGIGVIRDSSIPMEQKIFFMLSLLASILTGCETNVVQSFGRFMVILFPGFIVLAKWLRNENLFLIFLFFMFSIEVILTGMFVDGYTVV